MTAETELLPCPFCGGVARMRTEHDGDGVTWHYIQCGGCHVRTLGHWHSQGNDCPEHRAEVREDWNRRASPAPTAAPEAPTDDEWLKEHERLLDEYVSEVRAVEASAAGFDRVGARSHREQADECRTALLAHARLRPAAGGATLAEQQKAFEGYGWNMGLRDFEQNEAGYSNSFVNGPWCYFKAGVDFARQFSPAAGGEAVAMTRQDLHDMIVRAAGTEFYSPPLHGTTHPTAQAGDATNAAGGVDTCGEVTRPVAERQEVSIVLLPTSTRPAKSEPWEQCAALLLNPCDGFHLVYAHFDGDGEFDRFSDFASSEPYADDFYVAWALLPDELPLIHHFDPKRRPHGVALPEQPTGDEYHAANRCVDAAVLHLTGSTKWPDDWRPLREQFLGFIRAAAGSNAWQPIATAPKDGTHIWARNAASSFGWKDGKPLPPIQTTVHYWPHGDKPGFYTSVNETEPMRPFEATHWKPLDGASAAGGEAVARSEASAWWTLVMGAAASIEDAANCLRDPDAKKQADGAAKHYREAAQKLMAGDATNAADGVQVPDGAKHGND